MLETRSKVSLALATTGVASFFVCLVAREQFLTGDPVFYVGLAEALASGDGCVFMGSPHTKYPPGLPLLLAPFAGLFGTKVVLLQAIIAVFASVAVWAVAFLSRAWDTRFVGLVVVLTLLSVDTFVLATSGIRSELPFMAASMAALAVTFHLSNGARSRWIAWVLLPTLVSASVLMRTIGIALPMAFLCAWGQRRLFSSQDAGRMDQALLASGLSGLATAAAWLSWTSRWPAASESYVDLVRLVDPHVPDLGRASLVEILARIPGALIVQFTHLAELVTNIAWLKPQVGSPITVALVAALGVGLWRELRAPNSTVAWYVLGYGAILVMWPFDEGTRFLYPVFPALVVLGLRGGEAIVRSGRPPVSGRVRTVGWVVLVSMASLPLLAPGEGRFSLQNLAALLVWVMALVAWALVRRRSTWDALVRARGVVAASWVGVYCLLGGMQIVAAARSNLSGVATSPNAGMQPGIEWIRRNLTGSEVVMAESAATVHFYTGLEAVEFPKTGDVDALTSAMRARGVTHLLANYPPDYPYYFPTEWERVERLERDPRVDLRVEHVFGEGEIFRVDW